MYEFSPVQKVDRVGRPMVDDDGDPVMEPCYISIKELVECDLVKSGMALLGTHFPFS